MEIYSIWDVNMSNSNYVHLYLKYYASLTCKSLTNSTFNEKRNLDGNAGFSSLINTCVHVRTHDYSIYIMYLCSINFIVVRFPSKAM